jgi:GNAT superfamily N-acetyltransferase
MQYTIRQAKTKDMKEVHALVRELAIFEKEEQEHTLSLDDMTRDFEQGAFKVLLAEKGEEVLGMAFYYYAYSTWKGRFIFLEDLVVKAIHRKKGIGKALLQKLIDLAKEENMPRLKWEVLDWNQPAIDLYESIGAKQSGEWFTYRLVFED